MKKVGIIGAGFSGLASACYLAQEGFEVTIYEKLAGPGGRARQKEIEGFKFDMGPTWYWMPDVFERFFSDFGKHPSDYYNLSRLNPGYRVYFSSSDFVDVPADRQELLHLFESIEQGSSVRLEKFLKEAEDNYSIAIKDLVYRPGKSPMELVNIRTARRVNRFFSSIRKDVRKLFSNEKLQKILEFPVLFLGARPEDTPSFYSFMNYADLVLGTWYPKGGMYSVVESMVSLAEELGVKLEYDCDVTSIEVSTLGEVEGLIVNGKKVEMDVVLSSADYAHTEKLLPSKLRRYKDSYWESKTFAPSALLFYVGFSERIEGLKHHTLYFDGNFDFHANEIYKNPKWPTQPLFYLSVPTVSDSSIAPEGAESATFLVPLAPGLEDSDEKREVVFEKIMKRFEESIGSEVLDKIVVKESYGVSNFIEDYNSYKGNAYGLANTLRQTAFLRPKIISNKVNGLFFTGQLTVPGPGVPPALISGKLAAQEIINKL